MSQLRRGDREREKATYAAAGGNGTAAMKTDEDAPRSRMLRRTLVPVNQVALATSLQTQFECMPSKRGRTDEGIGAVDLLQEATGMYIDSTCALRVWS